MKSIAILVALIAGGSSHAVAGNTTYSCFTDGYEPGTTVEISFIDDAFEFKTFNLMPDGSQANTAHYGSNASTIQKLRDGRITVTGWDFSANPAPEATVVFEKDFKTGVFILQSDNQSMPTIASISCKTK
jgi:hypothetical protein